MKMIQLDPINRNPQIKTNERILDAMLAEKVEVSMLCHGRGLCATCHVFIDQGADSLTAMTPREKRTLSRISSASPQSRLACQARVQREGVKVRLPKGLYVKDILALESFIGKRAETNLLHPVTGKILVPKGKVILRMTIESLKKIDFSIDESQVKEA